MNHRPEEALKLRDIDQDIKVYTVWRQCWVNKQTDSSTLGIISLEGDKAEGFEARWIMACRSVEVRTFGQRGRVARLVKWRERVRVGLKATM